MSGSRSRLPRASWPPEWCCPIKGKIFLSVSARHKHQIVDLARRLAALGHELVATEGTARRLREAGIAVERVKKIAEGHPNLIDYMIDGEISLVMNTPSGKGARTDEGRIRAAAVQHGVSCITTIQAAEAAVGAMEALREEEMDVEALQDRFPQPTRRIPGPGRPRPDRDRISQLLPGRFPFDASPRLPSLLDCHRADRRTPPRTAARGASCAGPAREDQLLPIIDTHQHLWDLERQHVPWLDNAPGVLKRSYVSRDYLEATRGCHIVKAIYMEVDVPPSDHTAEVDLITRLCRSGESPTVAAVIGGRPGEAGFADYIRTQAKNPYVRGVRQVLHGATPRGYCLQDTFVQSMRLLGELGLLYDLCLRPEELPDAVTLVRQCPDTRFVVDHCGNADPQGAVARRASGGRPTFARSGRLAPRHGRTGEATSRHLQDQWSRSQGPATPVDRRRPGAGGQSLPG